jgi:aminomethyltransferase
MEIAEETARKTPFYDRHVACGGKIVPFAGYLLPVQYEKGVIAEHMAVRTAAGLFDVSHMGEASVYGPGALATLQHLCTNDFAGMVDGQVKYALLCDERGGVVDDVLVYRQAADRYLVVLNAANHKKDCAWMQANRLADATVEDVSDVTAQLALQGPRAMEIVAALAPGQPLPPKHYTFVPQLTVASIRCLASRTGYTGEDGVELYCAPEEGPALWDALLTAGAPLGLIPCGLGARDTLRLEAAMPLYGHELSADITPLEAGLGYFVKLDKPDFIGRDALIERGTPTRKRMGLRVAGRGIAREGCTVYVGGKEIGFTTSGTLVPYLGYAVAMALLNTADVGLGDAVEIDVRGRRLGAKIVPLPFYKRAKG